MPLLHTSIPNLAQGVSQQPDNLRYPGQCDEQINAWSTVVEGLVKRPNSRFLYDTGLGNTSNTQLDNLFTHYVNRDDQNQYVITYDTVNGLKAFDLTQDVKTSIHINAPSVAASTYLSVASSANPLQDLRALTIADSTFLVNTKKTVAKETGDEFKSISLDTEALIFVKQGDYEKAYSIYLDGQLVPPDASLASHHKYTTVGGSQPSTYISGPSTGSSAGKHADTEFIARDLQTCIDTFITSAGTLEVFTFSGGSGLGPNSATSYKGFARYSFFVDQYDAGTKIGSGAGGVCTVNGGAIVSTTLVQKGTGYSNSVSTSPYNTGTQTGLLLTIRRSEYYNANRRNSYTKIVDLTQTTPGVGWVTVNSVTVSGSATKFSTERNGSIIKISADTDFMIRVTDGLGDQALSAIYKEVDSITDLPRSCYNQFKVKIIGDADLAQDDYYVEFKTKDNEDFGEGSWIETNGWNQDKTNKGATSGIDTFLNQTTLPVRLIPDQTTGKITSLTLSTVNWKPRTAGDDNSNPFPSFLDKTINDIFFFKNRLGFLTDDSVVFSEADEYFNFFRTTTQSLLDSAPIDVGISHTQISILKYAQAFQQKLMIFSPKTQFVLRGGDLLTPKTVTISPVTEYDVSDSIRPLALSSYIYFNFKRNNFEGVLEYTVDNNTETYNATEITEQINKYIPTNIIKMEGSAAENMIVVQSDADYKKLYLYKYFWQGREKIQSAWMTFSFTREVRSFYFIEATLYVITSDAVGTYLEKIPMENNLVESDRNYSILLDSRVSSSDSTYISSVDYTRSGGAGLSFNGTTHFDVTKITTIGGFVFRDGMAVYTKNGNKRSITISNSVNTEAIVDGQLASYVSYSGNLYKCILAHTSSSSILPTNGTYWAVTTDVVTAPAWSPNSYEYLSEDDFFIGFEYDMLYRFSKQNLKQPTERGGRSASDYTFQTIRNGSVEYADTGHFTVEVTPKFRDTYTYAYNPTLLASVSTLNKFTPETGFFKFAVQAQPNDATIEIKSSSALPVKLLAAEFESTMIPRSRRYGS